MGKLKLFYKSLGIFTALFGIFILMTQNTNNTGAVIGLVSGSNYSITFAFALFFLVFGSALFIITHLDKQ